MGVLRYVLPKALRDYAVRVGFGHAETLCNVGCADSSRVGGANHQHVCLIDLRVCVPGSFHRSSLGVPVCHVVGVSAEEQVVRAHAKRCIASVADVARRVCDWSVDKLVSDARSVSHGLVHPKLPVSVCANWSCPQPAAVALGDPWPKAEGGVDLLGLISARARAVSAYLGDVIGHISPALCARLCYLLRPESGTRAVIALGPTVRRYFARPAQFGFAAYGADVFNALGVVLPQSFVAFWKWHRHLFYCNLLLRERVA